jgi:hypothetical protein
MSTQLKSIKVNLMKVNSSQVKSIQFKSIQLKSSEAKSSLDKSSIDKGKFRDELRKNLFKFQDWNNHKYTMYRTFEHSVNSSG